VEVAAGDKVWLVLVAAAALGFVELSRHQEPSEHVFAMTVAWVTVVTALLWVALK
jgi:hypothetical protein